MGRRHEEEQERYPESVRDVVALAVESARSRGKGAYDTSDLALALSRNPVIAKLYRMAGIEIRDLEDAVNEIYPIRMKGKIFKRPDPFVGQIEQTPEAEEIQATTQRDGRRMGRQDEGRIFDLFILTTRHHQAIATPMFSRARELGKIRRER